MAGSITFAAGTKLRKVGVGDYVEDNANPTHEKKADGTLKIAGGSDLSEVVITNKVDIEELKADVAGSRLMDQSFVLKLDEGEKAIQGFDATEITKLRNYVNSTPAGCTLFAANGGVVFEYVFSNNQDATTVTIVANNDPITVAATQYETDKPTINAAIALNTNHRQDARNFIPRPIQDGKVMVGGPGETFTWEDRIVVSPANYVYGFGDPVTLDPPKVNVFYEDQNIATGEANVWGPTNALGQFPAQADNHSSSFRVQQDPTAIVGDEYTAPKVRSLQQVDARIVFNGSEIDLRSTDGETLTDRKLHVIDGTTTNLDLTNAVEGARAWTIDLTNPAEPIRDFYRSNGTNLVKTLPNETHTHEVLENIAIWAESAGTNFESEIEVIFDGIAASDLRVSTAATGLESYTAHPTVFKTNEQIPGDNRVRFAHNKRGWLFFTYVGDAESATLNGVTVTGHNGAFSDTAVIVNFKGTNQHIDFDKASDIAASPVTLEFDQEGESASSLEIVRYTADGAIQDKDHRAIFETGAVNMTLAASTTDRLIQMVSEGPVTIVTANGAEEFTSSGGTSTDQKLTINETFKWATIIGRTAGGWSQYVGQVGLPAGVDESTPTKFKAGTRLVQNGIATSGTVTFPEAFKAGSTPTVLPVAQKAGDNVNVTLQSVSETGFNAWIVRNESDVGLTSDVHWIAIGERN